MREIKSFQRLFWSYLIAIMGPMIIVGAITIAFFFTRLAYNVRILNESILQQSQNSMDTILKNAVNSAFTLNQNEDVRNLIQYSNTIDIDTMAYYYVRTEIGKQALSNGTIQSMGIFLPKSGVILDNRSLYKVDEYYDLYLNETEYDLSWWQELFANGAERAFFAISRNGYEREPVYLVYCQPMNFADKSCGGVFLMVLNYDRVQELLQPLLVGGTRKDKAFALVNEKGELVMCTSNFGRSVDVEKISGQEGEYRDGGDLVIYRTSQMVNLKYVYVFHQGNWSGDVYWLAVLFVLLLLICLLISILLAKWSARKLQRPILKVFSENDILHENLDRYIEKEHDRILVNLLLHIQVEEEWKQASDLLHRLGLEGEKMQLALLGTAKLESFGTGGIAEKGWNIIIDTVKSVLEKWEGSYRLVQMSTNLACILSYDDSREVEQIWTKIIAHCRQLGLNVSIGLDDPETNLEHLWYSYDNAVSALHYAVRQCPGEVVHFSEMQSDENSKVFYNVEKEIALIRNIKNGAREQTEELLDEIYRTYFLDQYLSSASLMQLVASVAQIVYKLIESSFAQDPKNCAKYRRVCKNALQSFRLEDGFEILRQCCLDLCDYMAGQDRNAMFRQKVVKFVEENYMRSDLSLRDLADYMGLNYYYLSRQFKGIVGDNFASYLTAFRMEKAKEKLEQKDVAIKQVAVEVGFSDSNSFIRAYKKYYHTTPGHSKK